MVTLKTAVIVLSGGILFFIVAAGPLAWVMWHTDGMDDDNSIFYAATYFWLIICVCFALIGPVMGKIS